MRFSQFLRVRTFHGSLTLSIVLLCWCSILVRIGLSMSLCQYRPSPGEHHLPIRVQVYNLLQALGVVWIRRNWFVDASVHFLEGDTGQDRRWVLRYVFILPSLSSLLLKGPRDPSCVAKLSTSIDRSCYVLGLV